MRSHLLMLALIFGATTPAFAQTGTVQMSVLPAARSGGVNEDITFFSTLVSTSSRTLTCSPMFNLAGGTPPGVTANAEVFALDSGGAITGFANGFFTIDPEGRRDLLVVLNVDGAMRGPLDLDFRCQTDEGDFLFPDKHPGVNDFHVTITDTPGPDIVMIGDTISQDGVARVGDTGPRAALMTVAAVNIGASASDLTVRPFVTGYSMLDRMPALVCELSAESQCLTARAPQVDIASWPNGEVRFFAAFYEVPPHMGLPFWPDILRVAVGIGPQEGLAEGALAVSGNAPFNSGLFLSVTTSAVTAQPLQTSLMNPVDLLRATAPELTDGPYQCVSRGADDPAALRTLYGGVVVVNTPRDRPDIPGLPNVGYLRAQDINNDPYAQPISLAPRAEGGSGYGLTLLGMGLEQQQARDAEIDAQVEFVFESGMRINWDGNPALPNSFFLDGSARCVQVPDGTHAVNTPPSVTEDASVPAAYEVTADGRRIVELGDGDGLLFLHHIAKAQENGLTDDTGWLIGQLHTARTVIRDGTGSSQRVEEIDVTDAFLGFFAMLGSADNPRTGNDAPSADGDPAEPITGILFAGPGQAGTGPVDCLVAILPDNLFDGLAGADDDARVELMVRLTGPIDNPDAQTPVEVDAGACLP